MDAFMPFFSSLKEQEKDAVSETLTTYENKNDEDGTTIFVNALTKSVKLIDQDNSDDKFQLWQKISYLLPDIQSLKMQDNSKIINDPEINIQIALAIYFFETVNNIQINFGYSLPLRTLIADYLRKVRPDSISQNKTPNGMHQNYQVGYDTIKADKYSRTMEILFKKYGSIEQEILLRFLGNNLDGKIIMDTACGLGNEMSLLREKGAEVYGIDGIQKIQLAKNKYPNLKNRFRVGDVYHLPFRKEIFDVIISKYVLNEIQDIDAAIIQSHRCLKPGGILVVFAHHPMSQMAFSNKPEDYFGQNQVNVRLGKELEIKEWQHQVRQYLSILSKLFIIDEYDERQDPAQRLHINKNYPEMMIIKAVKRNEALISY